MSFYLQKDCQVLIKIKIKLELIGHESDRKDKKSSEANISIQKVFEWSKKTFLIEKFQLYKNKIK